MAEENMNPIDTNETPETPEVESFTREQVDAMIKAEADRRVSQALKTQAQKYDKQLKLANLDENQRHIAERDDRIAELEGQLRDFNAEKNKSEIKTVLGNHGLPVDFADLISIGEDYEEALNRVNTLEKVFKDAVANEVKRRLAGTAPTAGNTAKPTEFGKMSLAQKQALYNNNPDLYRAMSGK